MPKRIDIPWTHCEVFKPKITAFFGEPDETWNDHMEADRLLPFDETVKRIWKRLVALDHEVTVRAHSLWCRALIHTIIENPEVLGKINEIALICPPISMTELAQHITSNRSRFLGKFLEKEMPLMFQWNFLESLRPDTASINDRLINTLVETNYNGVRVHFDPDDRFFRINRDDYEEQVMNMVVAATPLISVTKNSYGHNYERYPG